MSARFTEFRLLARAYLTLGFIGTAAAVMGILGGANSLGLFGDSGGSSSAGAGGNNLGSTGALNTVLPGLTSAYGRLSSIDPGIYTGAANRAGNQYGDLSNFAQMLQGLMLNQGAQSAGAATDLYGAGRDTFAAAQDPRSALYNRTLQQVQDQSRAASSIRGIGMSPYSAGLENDATRNFNIDWQNQQLGRMLSGLQGMTGAYGGAGQQGQLTGANLTGAMNFGAQAPAYTLASGQVPWQAWQTAFGAPIDWANKFSTGVNTAFNPNLANYNQNQSSSGTNALLTGLDKLGTQWNQPGSWLNNTFGSGGNDAGNYGGSQGTYDIWASPGGY